MAANRVAQRPTAKSNVDLAPNLVIGAPVHVRGAAGERPPGSIGAYVANADGIWLVSANHVLAGNGLFLPQADPAHGVYAGDRRISRTVVFSHLGRHGNRADAAACLLEGVLDFVPQWPPGWRPNPHPHLPPLRKRVKVFAGGRDCLGVVAAIGNFRVSLRGAGFPGSLGEAEFAGSILVRVLDAGFARPGNSGGLVVTADAACRPVGLVTGTSIEQGSGTVVVSPLTAVLACLGLSGPILV
jgi:hypothetical protein